MKPKAILRFEKIQTKGRLYYVLSTAFWVTILITTIQWFTENNIDWRSIALYALLGAIIAQVDWLLLAKRYRDFNDPNKFNPN